MKEHVDDMLDLILVVFTLVLIVATGFSESLSMYKEAKVTREAIQNKNVRDFHGYGYNTSKYDGELSLYQVEALIQCQDYSMPEPREIRVIDIYGNVYGTMYLEDNYREQLLDYSNKFIELAKKAGNVLGSQIQDMKYGVKYMCMNEYDANDNVTSSEEFYAIICALQNQDLNDASISTEKNRIIVKYSDDCRYLTIQIDNPTYNSEAVTGVQFPTWSETNGQDDLVWYTANKSGTSYKLTIDLSKHESDDAVYIVHIYGYDKDGNFRFIDGKTIGLPGLPL